MAPQVFALVLTVLLCACEKQPVADSAPAATTILILSPPGIPVVEQVTAEVARRNALAAANASLLRIEAHNVTGTASVAEVVRSLRPQMARFRAIFTPSQSYARAAQLLVPDQPIVFDGVDDPVANCLVDSLREPGRNATGYMHKLPDAEMKMLELLHDGFPDLRSVIVLASGRNVRPGSCDPADPFWHGHLPPCVRGLHDADASTMRLIDADRITTFGRRLGMAVRFMVMCDVADVELLHGADATAADVGFVVPWHSLFDDHLKVLVETFATTRRPAIYPSDRFTRAGGLLSLEPILDRGADRAAVLTLMQVIDGRAPASLPVQTPRGFEIVLNADAAAAQGLRPSPLLMRRADRTIAN